MTQNQEQAITATSENVFTDSRGLTSHLRLLDYATLVYICVLTVIVGIWGPGRVAGWQYYLFAHFVVAALILGFIFWASHTQSRLVQFFRDVYPLILFTFMFKEVSLIINIFFPFWLESHLIAWDLALFGEYPILVAQKFSAPWFTEFMAFSYWSYYLLMPFGAFLLYFRRNREMFRSFIFNLSFTMYFCYFSYLFLTARGPRQTLAHLILERAPEGFFDNMVMQIQATAAITGAAFPSSHVAAVWVIFIFIFRYQRLLGWLVLPLVVALTFSTVYLQYHYASDAIAGVLTGCLTYMIGRFIERHT